MKKIFSSNKKPMIALAAFLVLTTPAALIAREPEARLHSHSASSSAQAVAALIDENISLKEKQAELFKYFMWLTGTIVAGSALLIILNVRESRKKDRIILSSEQFLRHSIQAQEAERKRISLELHDSVAQTMRYVLLLAESLKDQKEAKPIITSQTESIIAIRNLCYNLTPPDITGNNMISAINELGMKLFDIPKSGFDFRVVAEPAVDFSGIDTESLMNIYRIVQEAMQNIHKHAKASEATVLFKTFKASFPVSPSESARSLKIIISDDGCGMDASLVQEINSGKFKTVGKLHFGLRNIFERAKLLGAGVTFRSEEDFGTQISLEI